MGRKSTEKWVYILKDATLCFRESHINKFIEMWNNGESIKVIADKLSIKIYEVGLLVIHCELDDLIEQRDGGLWGTKAHKRK